jgi:Glycosyl transferase family 2
MPKLVALLRVKNGMQFLETWLNRIETLVDEIVVVDNGSTDGTLKRLQAHSLVTAIEQTAGFDEGRDKSLLYEVARQRKPDWCLWLDVDEIIEENATRAAFDRMMADSRVNIWMLRRYNFHQDYDHYIGGYKGLRDAIFADNRLLWREMPSGYFNNIKVHNGLVQGIPGPRRFTPFRIKHYGGVEQKLLDEKTALYLAVDDDPKRQAMYRHHQTKTWSVRRWYEYRERPLLVTTEHVVLTALYWPIWLIELIRQPQNLLLKIKKRIQKAPPAWPEPQNQNIY